MRNHGKQIVKYSFLATLRFKKHSITKNTYINITKNFYSNFRLKEEKEENDDEEELHAKRRMDEYKDEHKRGEGNRHNMG